jgi:putative transposase
MFEGIKIARRNLAIFLLQVYTIDMILHIYNRGVDKRKVFYSKHDYDRFVYLLYLCNSNNGVRVSDALKGKTDIFQIERGTSLVEINSWCLMPNHFHVLISTNDIKQIGKFMQKVMTAYTMYFNKKNARTGPLFSGVFKFKYITDDTYLEKVLNYIHTNPLELYPGNNGDMLREYRYSSLIDVLNLEERGEARILDLKNFPEIKNKNLKEVINFARFHLTKFREDFGGGIED